MSMSHSKVIREWLAEYKSLAEAELNTYANTIRHNDDLVSALYELFEDSELAQEVTDPVCHQLFEFYRSGREELQQFTLGLVPTLILIYLSALSRKEKRRCAGIEACLLGIYNLEIVDKDGSPKVHTFTIPTLGAASIYHEPPSLATLALTESALLRYHSDEPVVISIGPLPPVESVNAQNRLSMLTKVLSCYNADIARLSTRSHEAFCKMGSRLARTGFDNLGSSDTESANLNDSGSTVSSKGSKRGVRFLDEPRIPLNSEILIELLNGIYYIMYSSHAVQGVQAVDDIHQRASFELYSDVLLVTNAIKNSLSSNPSGAPQDGPVGISIALSPTTSLPSFAKHAITNASFRAKVMPEDIEVPDNEEDGQPPPEYCDLFDSHDKVKLEAEKIKAGIKLGKPLKGIMKKDKNKVTRRESDRKRDSGESQSPRNSVIPPGASAIPTSMSLNGEITDPSLINVSVVRSSSRTCVDQIELKSHDLQHRRTASYPEDGGMIKSAAEECNHREKPIIQPASHIRDARTAFNGSSSGSSHGSLNTQL